MRKKENNDGGEGGQAQTRKTSDVKLPQMLATNCPVSRQSLTSGSLVPVSCPCSKSSVKGY